MAVNHEPRLVEPALLEQAEQLCRKRLLADPDNCGTLHAMGQVYRKQGNLAAAAEVYAKLTRLDPEDAQARYLHAIFSGLEEPPSPEGIIPSPFVLLKNVLPAEIHQALLPLVTSIQDRLRPALVGNGEYKPDSRESLDLPNPLEWDVIKQARAALRNVLLQQRKRLNIPAFDPGQMEFKLRVYKDGHFFRTHSDVSALMATSTHRKLSYVYFFHKTPRPYTGGDLVLFDSDIARTEYSTASFTRVVPEDNAVIMFPSPYFHCVVPLKCGDDFTDSRFVINGHVSERVARPLGQTTDEPVATNHA